MAVIEPGKRRQNGCNETFNSKLRDESLNLEWFRHRTEATAVIETCPQDYNGVGSH